VSPNLDHLKTPPPPTADESAQERVVRQYFETTSGVGDAGAAPDYSRLTAGLRRGLGDWLDVRGREVVDLGCGKGELCWLAVQGGARAVVGVNLSRSEIEFARPHVAAEFACEDILSYLRGRATRSVDVVYALNILEHLDADTLARVLEEASRCLADEGVLVAMVPNATSPFGAMTRYWDFTHHRAFTPSSVRQLMRLCGFASAEFREWGPVPHGVASAIRWLLWQGYRAAIAFRLLVETGGAKGGVYTADMLFRLRRGPRPPE
jgi:SAM-dependent methyltransferase